MPAIEQLITRDETSMINRIAYDIHKTYAYSSATHEFISKNELYHYGIQGLLEARKRFKTDQNIPWLAFASYRVRGNMLDNIRKLPFIKLPYEQCKKLKLINKTKQRLLKEHGTVSIDQIAKELYLPIETVHKLLDQKRKSQTLSLSVDQNRHDGKTKKTITFLDALKDTSPNPEKQLAQNEIADLLRICLERLHKKDQFILICRIVKGLKLREVADSLGCSQENIRRRQSKAENQMGKCITDKGWSLNMCLEVIT